jgi:hypothetical protein
VTTTVAQCFFSLKHPAYAPTRRGYSGIPQQADLTLRRPAVIEGRVIDMVTGQPVADAPVSAQGIANHSWLSTRTDQRGRYRLLTDKGHFNIWAEADDRIAIAVKTLAAEPGKTISDADIRLVRGGFVVGTVVDGKTGRPVTPVQGHSQVAHYGPARPRTGASVMTTVIGADGTYRLRVAPGRNYIYVMDGSAAAFVDVKDGQEVEFDLRTGDSRDAEVDDPDQVLGDRLRRQARDEEAESMRPGKAK